MTTAKERKSSDDLNARRVALQREPDPEDTVTRVVRLLNAVNLTADQAERVATIAAARASRPRNGIVRVQHVMAMLDGATIDRDEAKLIGIRALRRASHLEEAKRIPQGRRS